MNIQTLHLIQGAGQAQGLTVIIDVFRAFSLECYLYDMGAAAILPVGDLDVARRLKAEHPDYVLIGERGGKKCEGFDFGNSPSTVDPARIAGKTIVHTTSAGTQGVQNAVRAQKILTGSLVNARAVARYILAENPAQVSLVCMGNSGVRPAKEDELCAAYLESLLTGKPMQDIRARAQALRLDGGAHFFDPALQDVFPQADFDCCTQVDRFDFVIEIDTRGPVLAAVKRRVS